MVNYSNKNVVRISIIFLLCNISFHQLIIEVGAIPINPQLVFITLLTTYVLLSGLVINGKINKINATFIKAYVLYSFIAFMSSILISDFNIHVVGLIVNSIFAISLSLYFSSVGKSNYNPYKIFDAIIILSIFEAMVGFYQFLTGGGLGGRVIGTYRDPVDFAFFVSIGLVCLLHSRNFKKIYKVFISIILLLSILLTQSFTNFLGLFIYLLIYLSNIKLALTIFKKNYIIVLMVIISIIPIGIVAKSSIENSPFMDMLEIRLNKYLNEGDDDNERILHLVVGWKLFEASNYKGIGYGNYNNAAPQYVGYDTFTARKYQVRFKKNGNFMISHVLFATIIAELGVIGILAILYVIYSLYKPLKYLNKGKDLYAIYLAFFVLYISRMCFYGFRISDAMLVFIVIIFGNIASNNIKQKKPIVKLSNVS